MTKNEVLAEVSPSYYDSATEISRSLGYSRKNDTVQRFLTQLVNEGAVETTSVSGYVAYRKVSAARRNTAAAVAPTQAPVAAQSSLENAFVDTTVNNFGYTVENLSNGTRKVTDPNGKSRVIAQDERIVVVNNDNSFRKIVKKPEHILTVIQEYSTLHKMSSYVVTNSRNNESLGEDCFAGSSFNQDEPSIIFLGMAQHNKAA